MAQLGVAWCVKNPRVSTVILGASKVEQLAENLGALELAPRLDAAVMERIEGILGNKPVMERDWR
jgi:aryl-alcohol dehydrogenase-like predicted oxidoreductase